jgi:hypothetical protein
MIHGKYYFQKLTQFSEGNNVLNTASSKVDGFLWGDTCVSTTQLNLPIFSKLGQSPP